jgi:hypothetical protein
VVSADSASDGTLAIIGLARNGITGLARSGITGLPFELARAIATRLHTHRKGHWNHPYPMVWPPPLSYRQMRGTRRRATSRRAVPPPCAGAVFAAVDQARPFVR